MGTSPRRRRPRGRRLLTCGGPALAVAGVAVSLLAGTGPAGAAVATSAPGAAYSALDSTAPAAGLRIVPGPGPAASVPAGEPQLPVAAPAGAGPWPVAATVRSLALDVPGLSAWIARSSEGGICVLLYDGVDVRGIAALYVGCAAAGEIGSGTQVEVAEIPGIPGTVIAAGVVPDGVSSVSQTMEDGTTVTSVVQDDAWAREGTVAAAPGTQPIEEGAQ